MNCLKCSGRLATVRIEDVDVDRCDACGGIWFDALELERVVRGKDVAPLLGRGAERTGDDARRARCPRCKTQTFLLRVASRVAPIHVDTCAVCGGTWLDGGELEQLRQRGVGATLRRMLTWVLEADLGGRKT